MPITATRRTWFVLEEVWTWATDGRQRGGSTDPAFSKVSRREFSTRARLFLLKNQVAFKALFSFSTVAILQKISEIHMIYPDDDGLFRIIVSTIRNPLDKNFFLWVPFFYKGLREESHHSVKETHQYKEKIKYISVSHDHPLASLDLVSLSIPYVLVNGSFRNQWPIFSQFRNFTYRDVFKK